MRDKGLKLLSTVIKHSKNCEIIEKNIYKNIENDDDYLWTVYQICGLLLKDKKSLKNVDLIVKKGDIGWKLPLYEIPSKRIEEHDQYLVNPFEVVEGVLECHKCGSKKTMSVQIQTRSSDEPMTTFSKCVDCGTEWRYSG